MELNHQERTMLQHGLCPTGCREIVRAPIQAFLFQVSYCPTCHRRYINVPLLEWATYHRIEGTEKADPRILPFHKVAEPRLQSDMEVEDEPDTTDAHWGRPAVDDYCLSIS